VRFLSVAVDTAMCFLAGPICKKHRLYDEKF
jgi:hypothetical protein